MAELVSEREGVDWPAEEERGGGRDDEFAVEDISSEPSLRPIPGTGPIPEPESDTDTAAVCDEAVETEERD